jgi:hypothetical protein
MEQKKKNLIISAFALSLTEEELSQEIVLKFERYLLPFLLPAIGWTFILAQMVFAYRNISDWLQTSLTILYTFVYSGAFVLLLSFFSSFFITSIKGFGKRFYFGLLASFPVAAIALIGLVLQFQIGTIKVLGYFPEHACIFGAYITIFSHVRLVSLVGRRRAIVYLFLLTFMVYILLGPAMFELFKL